MRRWRVSVDVDSSRVERLVKALAAASIDLFDAPEAQVEPACDDEFGYLEAAFKVFLTELGEAKRSLQDALTEAQTARVELEQRLATIEQQRLTIRELSTPILEL